MATRTYCDLCDQEIPIGKKAITLSVHEGVAASSQDFMHGRAAILPANIAVSLEEQQDAGQPRHVHIEVCLGCAAERPLVLAAVLEKHGTTMRIPTAARFGV